MKRIVIFASSSGTNAENIIKYFHKKSIARITKVLCNNSNAKVFDRCKNLGVDCEYFNKTDLINPENILKLLKNNIDFIVLAGFLLKIPKHITDAFPNKIINIHPALLPKYGGKGMYGMNVHKAVKENNETETGITIHYVNEEYDEGNIIFQAKTSINSGDTAELIARKIHQLEYKYFPEIIEEVITKKA